MQHVFRVTYRRVEGYANPVALCSSVPSKIVTDYEVKLCKAASPIDPGVQGKYAVSGFGRRGFNGRKRTGTGPAAVIRTHARVYIDKSLDSPGKKRPIQMWIGASLKRLKSL